MKQSYSDQLIAYIYNEIEPSTKRELEAALETNSDLRNEFTALKESLGILQSAKICSPSQKSIERILNESFPQEQVLLTD